MNRLEALVTLFFVLWANGVLSGEEGVRVLEAVWTDEPPEIDGKLDDAVWEKAKPSSGFIQVEPVEYAPAEGDTVVYTLYDEENLYFGFRFLDPEPKKIRAVDTERDAFIWDDDCIQVFLDTYHDKRSAFCFVTNSLGAQLDQKIAREGEVIDRQWDCEWEAEASLSEDGWCAEMAIPFEELSFDPRRGNTWGVNFWRNARGRRESTTWSDVKEKMFRVSRYGELRGLDLSKVRKPRKFEFVPYVTSSVDFSDSADADFETGLDISYRPTRSIFIDGTINPDISQIEADPTIISLTGVEPYIPEKRPFFKEGVDLLRSPIRVFYTRRVGYNRTEEDRYIYEGMDYGLKVSGRTDRYHFLGLAARTKESDEDYYVAAYQHNVGERSSVSLLAVDKEEPDDGNRALSLMGYLALPKEYELTTQYVYIQGENIDDDDGLYIGVERRKDPFDLAVRYSQIGPEFATIHREFGFLPVTEEEMFNGWRGFDGRASYAFEFGDRFIREIGVGTDNEFFWNYDDEKVQQENELKSWIRMGYFGCWVFGGRETNLEESGEVVSDYVGLAGGYEPKWGGIGFFTYPLGTPREPDARYISVDAGWKLTRRLFLGLDTSFKWYEDSSEEEEWNSRLRATYSFAKDLSLRVEAEVNSYEAGFANLLFRWKYRRNSFLYVGLNLLEEEEEEDSRLLFVKATYSF